ncbi:MAG: GNAT family N-acetyltransferase [Acidimicrobiales bacterium]
MTIRDARPSDLDAIVSLIHALADYENMTEEVLLDAADLRTWLFGTEPAARVLVSEASDGSVVGMALYFATFSTFLGRPGIWLEDLFVLPEHRGEGRGRALLQALRSRSPGRVEWSVLDWNEPAISFYEHLGARPLAGWTRYRWMDEAGPSQAADGPR